MTKLRSSKRLNKQQSTSKTSIHERRASIADVSKKIKKEQHSPEIKTNTRCDIDQQEQENKFNDCYLDESSKSINDQNDELNHDLKHEQRVDESIDVNICLYNDDDDDDDESNTSKLYIQCKCTTPIRILKKFIQIKLKIIDENIQILDKNQHTNDTHNETLVRDLLESQKKENSLEICYKLSKIKLESLNEHSQIKEVVTNRPVIRSHDILINGHLSQNTPPPSPLMRLSRPASNTSSSAFQVPPSSNTTQQAQQQQQQSFVWPTNAYQQSTMTYQQWQYQYAAFMYQQQLYEAQMKLQQQQQQQQQSNHDSIILDFSTKSQLPKQASAFLPVKSLKNNNDNNQHLHGTLKRQSDPLALDNHDDDDDYCDASNAKHKRVC